MFSGRQSCSFAHSCHPSLFPEYRAPRENSLPFLQCTYWPGRSSAVPAWCKQVSSALRGRSHARPHRGLSCEADARESTSCGRCICACCSPQLPLRSRQMCWRPIKGSRALQSEPDLNVSNVALASCQLPPPTPAVSARATPAQNARISIFQIRCGVSPS